MTHRKRFPFAYSSKRARAKALNSIRRKLHAEAGALYELGLDVMNQAFLEHDERLNTEGRQVAEQIARTARDLDKVVEAMPSLSRRRPRGDANA